MNERSIDGQELEHILSVERIDPEMSKERLCLYASLFFFSSHALDHWVDVQQLCKDPSGSNWDPSSIEGGLEVV
jgi:hypothetical protein